MRLDLVAHAARSDRQVNHMEVLPRPEENIEWSGVIWGSEDLFLRGNLSEGEEHGFLA